eukprot:1897403-Rhodomonas_salina.1
MCGALALEKETQRATASRPRTSEARRARPEPPASSTLFNRDLAIGLPVTPYVASVSCGACGAQRQQ